MKEINKNLNLEGGNKKLEKVVLTNGDSIIMQHKEYTLNFLKICIGRRAQHILSTN